MTSPPSSGGFFHRLAGTLELIKFAHSVFALPFALSSHVFIAARGLRRHWATLRLGSSGASSPCPHGRDVFQPLGRLGPRSVQPAHQTPLHSSARGGMTMTLCIVSLVCLRHRLLAAEPALPRALPGRLFNHSSVTR